MPLDWKEVHEEMNRDDFTIITSLDRSCEKGDLFAGVLGKGIARDEALKKVKELMHD